MAQDGRRNGSAHERKALEELAARSLLDTINGALRNAVLPRLHSLAEGGPDGWRIKGHSLVQMLDQAAGWVGLQVVHAARDRNVILTAHTYGEDHAACLIVPYVRHPVTGELYLATVRQNRISFYFDAKEMKDGDADDPYRPNKGWISEFVRGFARPDLADIETPGAYEASQRIPVSGLEPWMPKEIASDVRRLAARELGGVLVHPDLQVVELDCFGRYNENSGNSTVFIYLFAMEVRAGDPAVLGERLGGRRERASFHPEKEMRRQDLRSRTAFGFGQEALSMAALWMMENADRYRHLFKH